jgi:precorrin-6A synthase
MRRVLVIGIGAGNPDHLTLEAIEALNQADVFFMLDKGEAAEDLVRLREELCARHIRDPSYRIVRAPSPVREKSAPSYEAGVEAWHREKGEVFKALIGGELGDDECGAFLVWGEPSLYDSTLRILHQLIADGAVAFEYRSIPGISAAQALAAAHGIPLNRIGESVLFTTGRRLAEGLPADADSIVVFLDGGAAFKAIDDEGVEIYWGAYLGTEHQILVSGSLHDTKGEIERIKQTARRERGWIMDTYLLRRPPRR